ncbi:MAG: hypothetical protein Q8P28_11140 [Deltaproteobacteria bacterium]|nr:hypothetical protein [Deltaproteobacteria bacterium]
MARAFLLSSLPCPYSHGEKRMENNLLGCRTQVITDILKQAEHGLLDCCKECPWSPIDEPSVGFGVSCTVHGMNWNIENKANSMIMVQDPGDTTPHRTGRLCAVHNAENPTDKTAQQNLQLWKAAVSLNWDAPEDDEYLKKHYWTNTIMHGASAETGLRERSKFETARECCSDVLALQILALKPKVLIASGTVAVNNLHDIGVIARNWASIRHEFNAGAYCEEVNSWRGLPLFKVFCTYHTSAGVVNRTLSRKYDSVKTEKLIAEKSKMLNSTESIIGFLSSYGKPASNATDRGMRFLLNHWLDIGLEIREQSKNTT